MQKEHCSSQHVKAQNRTDANQRKQKALLPQRDHMTHWRTGSQCGNYSSSGRACALLGDCVTILATVFWTRCSFWILPTGAPYNTALK